MGATYTYFNPTVANATNKNLSIVQNATGSGKTVYIRRVWFSNNRTATVTGGVALIILGCYTGTYAAGTDQTALLISMDSTNAALPAQITANTNSTAGSITIDREFRRIPVFTDEFAVSDASSDMLNVVPGFSLYWDSGYTEPDVQPIVVREGEGFVVKAGVAPYNLVGDFNIMIEIEVV